jgi:hypothetical protein
MKKIFLLLIIASLISCDNRTINRDVKLNPDTGDTLEITKRYSSNKIREIIKYKDNQPNSNTYYLENGDSINHPKFIYLGVGRPSFVFIPIKKYQYISLVFVKGYDAFDSITGTIDKDRTLKSIEIKNSTDIFIDSTMVSGNYIIGAIKCKDLQETYHVYTFEEKIK